MDANMHAELMDEWALAIGRFLVSFTACEYWTYQYVRTFGSPALHDAVADLNLNPRAAIAHALVTDIGLIAPVQSRVDVAFAKLAELARPRNLVAHNGPLVNIYARQDGTLLVRHELRSAKDPAKEMTVERLRALAKEARVLDEEMALLYGVVRKSESRMPPQAVAAMP